AEPEVGRIYTGKVVKIMDQLAIHARIDAFEHRLVRLEGQIAERRATRQSTTDRWGTWLDVLIHVGTAWAMLAAIEMLFNSPLIQISLGALGAIWIAQLWAWRISAN
ncbi:MAG: hypothetical protein ACE5F6_17870, partial [Anaerolineae bacterium]